MQRSTRLLIFTLLIGSIESLAQIHPVGLQPDPKKLSEAHALETQAIAKNDSVSLGKAYFLLGEAFHVSSEQVTAKSYYLKAIQTLKPKGDFYEVAKAYLRLNEWIHLKSGSREDIENAQIALGIFKRIHSLNGIALAFNYLTSCYKSRWIWSKPEVNRYKSDLARQDTLLNCINNIERYGRLAKDTMMMAEGNLQRADLLRHLKDNSAFLYYKEALRLFQLQRSDVSIIHTLCHMANTHLEFGQYKQADQLLAQAQALTDTKSIWEYLMLTHLYEAKRDYYTQTRQWRLAYEAMRSLSYLYTYRTAGERDLLVSSINVQLETEKKEALLRAQASELKSLNVQKQLSVALTALLLIVGGASIVFFRLYRKNQRISYRNQELVKEQNHRVKNNLQVVSSLLSLQSKRLSDEAAKKAIEESRLRVQSMAIVHQRLYDGERLAEVNLSDFIKELIQGVLESYGYVGIGITLTIDPISLSADKAVPLGLILNELATNACKYAFPYKDDPKFRISCRRQDNKVCLYVSDNGPGWGESDGQKSAYEGAKWNDVWFDAFIYEQPVRRKSSFGMQLIQAQVEQLGGTYQFQTSSVEEEGVSFFLEFNV